ncbi:aldehyde reductase [Daldinia caldariorum]|uniref:aldehyde reductase n=1 Tax=Daldinia caldariorum TaxID=326644 RepID=UPI00200731D5|nr:aldehyde reductase [Daldinia caldariorum]KAI1465438.1 aldehyde reductase [Daldinia caldariorum]
MAITKNPNLLVAPGSLVVVTGANGYIGSHIVDQFLQRGYRVRGTVRSVSRDQWLKDYFDRKYPGKFELVEVPDMVKSGAYDDAVKGASGFVHAAAPAMDSMQSPDPQVRVQIVVDSTVRALESASREPGIKRVVLTSSSGSAVFPIANKAVSIDSNTWNDYSVKEAFAPPPYEGEKRMVDVYYASKTKGEQAAWEWVRKHKPHFTFNAVLPDFNTGAPINVARQASRSTAGMISVLIEKGEAMRPEDVVFPPQWYIDVRDDAALHVAALIYSDVVDERLFGFAYPFNVNDVIRTLKALYPKHKFGEEIADVGRDLCSVTNERAEELLRRLTGHGWTSLVDSLRDTAEALGIH